MRITPLDVRKQEFKRGMRGYDNDEVRAFLANVADEYEAVLVDNKQLRERILEQDEKLTEFRNLEKALRDTLMTAEKVMQESKENARRQGEVVIAEARQRAQETLAEGRARLEELRREALAVHREKDTFLARFRSLAEAQIQFCEAHRHDFRDLDGRLLERPGPSAQASAAGPQAPAAPAPAGERHLARLPDRTAGRAAGEPGRRAVDRRGRPGRRSTAAGAAATDGPHAAGHGRAAVHAGRSRPHGLSRQTLRIIAGNPCQGVVSRIFLFMARARVLPYHPFPAARPPARRPAFPPHGGRL